MTLLFRIACLSVLLSFFPLSDAVARDKQATQEKINKIKQERVHLTRIRKQLEQQLGDLGRELHKLDSALLAARKVSREVSNRVQKADQKLADLQRERETLHDKR